MAVTEICIIGAGCAAGIACAGAFSSYGIIRNLKEGFPFEENEALTVSGGELKDGNGNRILLRICDLGLSLTQHEKFKRLTERFGTYGAKRILLECTEKRITAKDIAFLSKTGFNCVRYSFTYRDLFADDSLSGKADFGVLDYLAKICSEKHIYLILRLAPSFSCKKSTDVSASVLKEISTHFDGNPCIAGIEIGYDSSHPKELSSCISAVRKKNKSIPLIVTEGFTSNDDKLITLAHRVDGNAKAPLIIEMEFSEEISEELISEYSESGASFTAATFKGVYPYNEGLLFSREAPVIDEERDSFDDIVKKKSKLCLTGKGFTENKKLTGMLSKNLPCVSYGCAKKYEKPKPHFNVKFGRQKIKGI